MYICVDDDSKCGTCEHCNNGQCIYIGDGEICGNCKECWGGDFVYTCEACFSLLSLLQKTVVACCEGVSCPECQHCVEGNCVNDADGSDCVIEGFGNECLGCLWGRCINDWDKCGVCERCSMGECYNINCKPEECESCIDHWCVVCGGEDYMTCCEGADVGTCYDWRDEKCCDGRGNTCPKDKNCCDGTCYPAGIPMKPHPGFTFNLSRPPL